MRGKLSAITKLNAICITRMQVSKQRKETTTKKPREEVTEKTMSKSDKHGTKNESITSTKITRNRQNKAKK